ncbi:DNA polymerase epsilon noncatalytic subunit Ecym_4295 [Eremothecium cymbalariae DBVPG|uniref:DNA polymerase epsilon subunit D n=1 Tax=Eremothecium cymbalariae (strain CBS 270.75 / DBVPG 7215 / KCTC 17166 / NRRL Y-17582) TaxID=931890 RepID=G8JTK5_ERECY|nr:hypothetical protein Ecym_4295 [Eremothecium cymbalariae DBVPG\
MPPKGWKKDAQGNYPTTSYIKEQEKLTVDDLLFPKSIITALAKDSIQQIDTDSKILISKDASLALQRSSTVFVNHVLMAAREIAQNNDRKSCNEEDVLNALDQIGMVGFKSIVRVKVVEYEKCLQQRKAEKAAAAARAGSKKDDQLLEDNSEPPEQEHEQDDSVTSDLEGASTKRVKISEE